MYVLIETSGLKAKAKAFDTEAEAKEKLLTQYSSLIKTANSIDWRCTWIDLDESYAKIDTWVEIVEWRITELK